MEIAAFAGLSAIAYAVSQLVSPSTGKIPPGTSPQQAKAETRSIGREGFRTIGLGISPQGEVPSDPTMPVPSEYYTIGIQQYMSQEEAAAVKSLNSKINELAAQGNASAIQST